MIEVTGGAVAGLIVGGAAGYLASQGMAPPATTVTQGGVTQTVTQTVAQTVGAATTAPALIKHPSDRDYILIGHPNSVTGPLAAFGEASPWADERAIKAINDAGGIYIDEFGKKMQVQIKIYDTTSDPNTASAVASKLVLDDQVDMLTVQHTPDSVNPVDAIAERYNVPCVSLDAPIEPWLTGGPYYWSFHAFWTTLDIANVFKGMWNMNKTGTNQVVGFIMPNDPDGTTWSAAWPGIIKPDGYSVVDPGRFPSGLTDFTSFITQFKQKNAQILTGVLPPPDFATAWRQCSEQGFHPKMATIAKACLFPSAVEAIGGNLPEGLTTELWWSPWHPFNSSLTGESSKDLADAWETENKTQWTPPLGFTYAAYEIIADALTRAKSLDKAKIRDALTKTKLNTIVGPIQYYYENWSKTPLVGAQWHKGTKWPWEQQIVYNAGHPEIPITGKLEFPLP
jgi:branched-chain amino acid transport system substrate-binding protein